MCLRGVGQGRPSGLGSLNGVRCTREGVSAQQRGCGGVAGYRATVRGGSETRAAADEESVRRPAGCSASAEVHCGFPGMLSSQLHVSAQKLLPPLGDCHFFIPALSRGCVSVSEFLICGLSYSAFSKVPDLKRQGGERSLAMACLLPTCDTSKTPLCPDALTAVQCCLSSCSALQTSLCPASEPSGWLSSIHVLPLLFQAVCISVSLSIGKDCPGYFSVLVENHCVCQGSLEK